MAAAILLYGLAAIRFGELIPVRHGLGWDGAVYARITADFRHEVFEERLDGYRIQRVLPCAIVHYGLLAAGLSTKEDANVIRGFQVLNLALLVLGVYLWDSIAAMQRLGRRGRWLGFVSLFGSYAVLKMTFYYPVLTDTAALVIGMAMVHAYLAEKPLFLWLLAVAGAFIWPTTLYMAVPLLVFPHEAAPPAGGVRPLPLALYAAPAVVVAAAILYYHYVRGRLVENVAPTWEATVPLAVACVLVYLAAAFRWLVDREVVERLLRPLRETTLRAVLLAVAAVAVVKAITHFWLVPLPGGDVQPSQAMKTEWLLSIAKPGIFLVSHVVYFGPIVLAAVAFWPRVAAVLRSWGLGPVLAALVGLMLSVTSESRHLLAFVPLLFIATVQALEAVRLPKGLASAFVVATLVLSRFWLPLGAAEFTGDPMQMPDQVFFMSQGPWMAGVSYLVMSVVVLGTGLVLGAWYWFGSERNRPAPSSRGFQP
jgi:hypothetical protein